MVVVLADKPSTKGKHWYASTILKSLKNGINFNANHQLKCCNNQGEKNDIGQFLFEAFE